MLLCGHRRCLQRFQRINWKFKCLALLSSLSLSLSLSLSFQSHPNSGLLLTHILFQTPFKSFSEKHTHTFFSLSNFGGNSIIFSFLFQTHLIISLSLLHSYSLFLHPRILKTRWHYNVLLSCLSNEKRLL